MHNATAPAAAVPSTNSVAVSFGRWVSATLFFLSALTIFVFALQGRPAPSRYDASVQLSLAPLPGADATAEQSRFHFADDKGLIARWQPFIAEASQRFSIPEAWIAAVMRVESGGNTMLAGQPITSKAGASGLMQLMQDTYRDMRLRYRLGSDVHDPRDNIMAGAAYLQLMREKYGYPYMFAAYNAGPKRLDQHLQEGKSLPRETRDYLGHVVGLIDFAAAPASKPQQLASSIALRRN